MKATDIVRAVMPEATDEDAEWLLWERTPFPGGGDGARRLYRAASGWYRAQRNGRMLCTLCPNQAPDENRVCERCRKAIAGLVVHDDAHALIDALRRETA